MKFIIATHNHKKLAELRRILEPLSIDAVTAEEAGFVLDDVEETGKTFEENAELKAHAACKETGLPSIGDDSGLMVDALGGAPGVYSARYAGEHGNDGANIKKLLKNLENVPDEKRTAKFVCTVCCVFPDGREFTVRGECKGKIAGETHGSGGFGYDPVFMYGEKSFAELSAEEKDKVSHRGTALRLLAEKLPSYI